mmetsp:Transcript_115782/g.204683  ORF Transcript_115782/g.204683 Transcript_115782/m.204683 type:complete len:243 (-) Transcript_115782:380-1108(-)
MLTTPTRCRVTSGSSSRLLSALHFMCPVTMESVGDQWSFLSMPSHLMARLPRVRSAMCFSYSRWVMEALTSALYPSPVVLAMLRCAARKLGNGGCHLRTDTTRDWTLLPQQYFNGSADQQNMQTLMSVPSKWQECLSVLRSSFWTALGTSRSQPRKPSVQQHRQQSGGAAVVGSVVLQCSRLPPATTLWSWSLQCLRILSSGQSPREEALKLFGAPQYRSALLQTITSTCLGFGNLAVSYVD